MPPQDIQKGATHFIMKYFRHGFHGFMWHSVSENKEYLHHSGYNARFTKHTKYTK